MNLMQLLEWLNKDWAEKERQKRLRAMKFPGEPNDSEGYTKQMQLQQMFPELANWHRRQRKDAYPQQIPPGGHTPGPIGIDTL